MTNNESYIDRKECIRRGFVYKDGIVVKMSLLEKYAARGWLSFGNSRFSADDRMRAALRLQRDYEASRFMSATVSGWNEKVDCQSQNITDIESVCRAREAFFIAKSEVPEEFWPAVEAVCLLNKEPPAEKSVAKRRVTEMGYARRLDLCRGLDRLVRHYWRL